MAAMAPAPPPDPLRGDPQFRVLPAGTSLWRVHRDGRPVTSFNPTLADGPRGGGRFDATSRDPFAYLYAAPDQSTAVAERLLRDRPFQGGPRIIRRNAITGLRMSTLVLTRDIRLVALVSAVELAALYQDDWLVQAEGTGYEHTRAWAAALRGARPEPDGLIWQSRRDRPGLCAVLFKDRAGDAVIPGAEPPVVFDDEKDGERHLAAILAAHQSYIDAASPAL
jgi:hypothetical protein